MADFAGVLKELEALEAEASRAEETPESPGILRSFARGAAQSPADVLAMSPVGRRPDLVGLDIARAQAGEPTIDPTRRSLSDFREAPTRAESLRGALIRRSGIPDPETFSERVAERVGRTAPFVVATAPGSFGFGGFPALFTEIGADILASSAGESAAEAGGNVAAQIGVELLVSVVAPGAFVQNIAQAGARGVGKGTRGTIRAGKRVADAARGIKPQDEAAELRRIAKKYKVRQSKVKEAASELKRRIDKDPAGGEQFIDDAIDRLEEGLEQFPDATKRPTSRQILGEDASQNISSMEEGLARADLDFSASVAGRKRAVQLDLEEQFENLLPEGNASKAISAFEEIRTLSKTGLKDAWDAVPFDQMPSIPTRRLKQAVKRLRDESRVGQKFIPLEAKVIDSYGDTIPAKELQALRSELLSAQRAGSTFGAAEGAARRGNRVGRLLEAVQAEIDHLPREGGAQYLDALRLTRENKKLFSHKSAAVAALTENTEGRKIAAKIRGAKDPGKEARNAIEIVDQVEGGADSLRRVFIDELFDESLGQITPNRMLTTIRRNRSVYREILGKERLTEVEGLLKKVRTARVGRAGTPAAVAGTGTGVSPVSLLFSGAEVISSPVSATSKGIGAVSRWISRDARTAVERNAILREALLDPVLFKTLIEMPGPRALPDWVANWSKLVARSRIGLQLTRTSARNAGEQSANGHRSVTTPLPNTR